MEAKDFLLSIYHNLLRLDSLLRGPASRILRQCFRQRYFRITNTEWEDGHWKSKEFFKVQTSKKKEGIKWMGHQKDCIERSILDEFDVTLLAQVLKNIKWSEKTPNLTDGERQRLAVENDQIQKLVVTRNAIAHTSKQGTVLSEEAFNEHWDSCMKALIELDIGNGSETEEDDEAKRRKNLEIEMDFIRLDKNLEGLEFGTAKPSEKYMKESIALREKGDEHLEEDRDEEALQCYLEAMRLPGLSYDELRRLYSGTGQVRMKLVLKQMAKPMFPRAKRIIKEIRRNIEANPKWKEEQCPDQDPHALQFMTMAEEMLMSGDGEDDDDVLEENFELIHKHAKGIFKDVFSVGFDLMLEGELDQKKFQSKLMERFVSKAAQQDADSNPVTSYLAALLSGAEGPDKQRGPHLSFLGDLFKAIPVMFMGDKWGKEDEGFFQKSAMSAVKREMEGPLEESESDSDSSSESPCPVPGTSKKATLLSGTEDSQGKKREIPLEFILKSFGAMFMKDKSKGEDEDFVQKVAMAFGKGEKEGLEESSPSNGPQNMSPAPESSEKVDFSTRTSPDASDSSSAPGSSSTPTSTSIPRSSTTRSSSRDPSRSSISSASCSSSATSRPSSPIPSTSSQGRTGAVNVMSMMMGNNHDLLKNGGQIVHYLSKVISEKIGPLVQEIDGRMKKAKEKLDNMSINDSMELD